MLGYKLEGPHPNPTKINRTRYNFEFVVIDATPDSYISDMETTLKKEHYRLHRLIVCNKNMTRTASPLEDTFDISSHKSVVGSGDGDFSIDQHIKTNYL